MIARTPSARPGRGNPDVVIFMGSTSDWAVMAAAAQVLEEFGISHLAIVSSAHRSHDRTVRLVKLFTRRGTRVFIAGAGAAAHLAGAVAAVTPGRSSASPWPRRRSPAWTPCFPQPRCPRGFP